MEIKKSDYKCEGKVKKTFTEKSSKNKSFFCTAWTLYGGFASQLVTNYWTNCLLFLVLSSVPFVIIATGNTTKYKHIELGTEHWTGSKREGGKALFFVKHFI